MQRLIVLGAFGKGLAMPSQSMGTNGQDFSYGPSGGKTLEINGTCPKDTPLHRQMCSGRTEGKLKVGVGVT